jgi:hypothetical protein
MTGNLNFKYGMTIQVGKRKVAQITIVEGKAII